MSTDTIPPIYVAAVTVSAASPRKPKHHLKYSDIEVGSQQQRLVLDGDGSLRQQFSSPFGLTPTCQITLCPKKSRLLPAQSPLRIDTRRLLASATGHQPRELSVTHDDVRVTFVCQAQSGTEELCPTTQAILENCPRFRILVIGKMGVGKSSLINIAFGINKAHTSDLQRGQADIENELTSSVNPRFVLHDSRGFEPGDGDNYEIVKKFIRSRQRLPLEDRLHAVWFCIEAPRAGGRLLEAAAEDFFRSKRNTLGTIPIVVVFTKFDGVVNHTMMELMDSNRGQLAEGDIMKQTRSNADSTVRGYHNSIAQFAGGPVPYVAVSTKKGYEDTLSDLIQSTYNLVGGNDVPDAHVTSMVTMMAQRVDPHLKIRGSIAVGRQRYWKALRSSPAFAGHTIQDCLSVIHADIIAVWNFYDPSRYLQCDKFKELVIGLVHSMQVRSVPNPNRVLALSGGSLVAVVSGFLGALANPAAPIVLPIVAGLAAAVWIYDVYRNAKIIQQRFIAFIVDLTHIMETLFVLTGGDHKRLTRRIIKLAYNTYSESDMMAQVHTHIEGYRDLDGQDAALDMIETLIKPKRNGSSDLKSYYAEVGKLDLSALDLDRDESW